MRQARRSAVSPPLGDRIRKFRTQRRLSQEVLAQRAGISEGWLLQIENGRADPRFSHVIAIAKVLAIDAAVLLDDRAAAAEGRGRLSHVADGATLAINGADQAASNLSAEVVARLQEEMLRLTRRQAVAGGVAWAGAIVTSPTNPEPWERLAYALRHPGRVDRRTVQHLEEITVALERLEPVSSSEGLIGAVGGQLDTIGQLLQGSLPPAIRQELCSIAAETAGLAGWLRWIVDDTVSSDGYFRVALEAAQEADDRALGAYLAGRAACQPFYREQPAVRLQRLAGRSFGFSQADATPRTRAWLGTLEAEAYALLGDEDGCRRALDRVETTMQSVGDVDEAPRPRLSFFDRVWLNGQNGASLAKLGRPDAQMALRAALDGLDPMWLRYRAWLLVILAGTLARQGDTNEACRIGTQALSIAESMRAEADIQLVASLRGDLAPWATNPAVRQFDEQVRLALRA